MGFFAKGLKDALGGKPLLDIHQIVKPGGQWNSGSHEWAKEHGMDGLFKTTDKVGPIIAAAFTMGGSSAAGAGEAGGSAAGAGEAAGSSAAAGGKSWMDYAQLGSQFGGKGLGGGSSDQPKKQYSTHVVIEGGYEVTYDQDGNVVSRFPVQGLSAAQTAATQESQNG